MPWDGIKRRISDSGGEDPEIVLARIDERVRSLKDDFSNHVTGFKYHLIEDDKNFKRIDKTVYLATGVVTAVIFIVRMVFK